MPGSMLSWESEDYLVEEYEGLIKARTNTYANDPNPKCCQSSARGLSQYRPTPAIHVNARPKAR